MNEAELVIIGGGPAGLAAAVAAYDRGIRRLMILERDEMLGGILNQCIHNGFGLHRFREELTGPEYALREQKEVEARRIPYFCHTMVTDLKPDKTITLMGKETGVVTLHPDAVILAMGCRERPRGALNIPGDRPAGIYTAGTAQRLVNREGYLPGKRVVILGSGDIGLIMARRMTLEGCEVKCVAELMPFSAGLKRNVVQCLDDFGIPLFFNTTITQIVGKERVEGVWLAQVDASRQPIVGTERYVACDTVLLSVGLIPENELSVCAGVALDPRTKGAVVSEQWMTSVPGIFSCGNVLHVHDLVDHVSEEAERAGQAAAEYLQRIRKGIRDEAAVEIPVEAGEGVTYTLPQQIHLDRMPEVLTLSFRVRALSHLKSVSVYLGDERLLHQKKHVLAPGQMEQIAIRRKDVERLQPDRIRVCIEEDA